MWILKWFLFPVGAEFGPKGKYPFDSTHFGFFADFHWDVSGNWINIYKLCHSAAVVKNPKSSWIFFSGNKNKEITSFPEPS